MRKTAFILLCTAWFALLGPLVGGAPWNISIISTAFVICGLGAAAGGVCSQTLPKLVKALAGPPQGR